MWDGFHFLANAKSWAALPKDLQDIVARNINEAALKDRADLAALNATVAEDLKSKGMAFNSPELQSFRETLKKAGFYEEWKGKYGPEAWTLLEKYTGSLA
jgi:TRAP-type C4-dicarboxylate transport system substrate-binding protein